MRKLFAKICLLGCLLMLLCFGSTSQAAGIVIQPTAQLPQVVVRENFIQLSTNKLKEVMAENGEQRRYEIEAVNVPAGLRMPWGEITYKTFLPTGIRYGKNVQVAIDVYVAGKKYSQIRCTMRVHVFEKVVTAAHQLQREQALTAGDLRLEEREDNGSAMQRYTSFDQVVGKVVTRNVAEGTIIDGRVLGEPVLIKAYTKVYINADINGINVQTEGIAMENGRKNAVISVKNLNSNRIIRGKVIDENNVQVQ